MLSVSITYVKWATRRGTLWRGGMISGHTAFGFLIATAIAIVTHDLAVTALDRQLNYHENGLLLGAENEPQASENLAHLSLLAHPAPRRVLLIGGGFNGVLGEILKHAPDRVDYVELDPAWKEGETWATIFGTDEWLAADAAWDADRAGKQPAFRMRDGIDEALPLTAHAYQVFVKDVQGAGKNPATTKPWRVFYDALSQDLGANPDPAIGSGSGGLDWCSLAELAAPSTMIMLYDGWTMDTWWYAPNHPALINAHAVIATLVIIVHRVQNQCFLMGIRNQFILLCVPETIPLEINKAGIVYGNDRYFHPVTGDRMHGVRTVV